jgi:hypothetical protein
MQTYRFSASKFKSKISVIKFIFTAKILNTDNTEHAGLHSFSTYITFLNVYFSMYLCYYVVKIILIKPMQTYYYFSKNPVPSQIVPSNNSKLIACK